MGHHVIEGLDKLSKNLKERLEGAGYHSDRPSLHSIHKVKDSPESIKLAASALFHVYLIHECIEKDDTLNAISETMKLMDILEGVRFKKVYPDIELGQSRRKSQKTFGNERGRAQTVEREKVWKEWKAEADNLEKGNPALSKSDLARNVKTNLKLSESVQTIRKRI